MKKTSALLSVALIACMSAALPASAGEPRQIAITLSDSLRIQPDRIEARAGETVEFVVHNTGKLRHEFVIGEPKEVDEHAREMQRMGGMAMEGKSDMKKGKSSSAPGQGSEEELGRVDVKPGQTARLVYKFKKPGTLAYACLYPGHREAGMRGTASVK
jgi:uncharacterized cupredoxin-like copper-binding protein